MRKKSKILISSASVLFGLSLLIGGVFASSIDVYYATDETNPITARLTVDNVETTYYLTGDFGDVNWGIDPNYQLTVDPLDSNHYTISDVALVAGDQFKVKSSDSDVYSNAQAWTNCGFTVSNNTSIISNTGTYDISFYLDSDNNNHIVIDKALVKFRITNTTNKDIYLLGLSTEGWNLSESRKMTLVAGSSNIYEYATKLNVREDPYEYKFVFAKYSGGSYSETDWDTLNKDNRQINVASQISVNQSTKSSITFVVNKNTSNTVYVASNKNGWNGSDANYALVKSGSTWTGTFEFDKGYGLEYKFVCNGAWISGDNLTLTIRDDQTLPTYYW